MRKLLFGLLPIAVLAACQTPSNQPNQTSTYKPILYKYFDCMVARSERYARTSNEDPYYLALAAQNACGSERVAAMNAVYAAERPPVRDRIWRIYDDGAVKEMTAYITRKRAG